MKILFTLPYVPLPPTFGGALRVYHILKLVSRHHDVSILTFGKDDDERILRREFGDRIKEITIIPRHWPRRYRRLGQLFSLFTRHSFFYMLARSREAERTLERVIAENDFDLIQTEFAHMASYAMKTGAVKILDAHNVEYDNFRRMWEKAHSPLRKLHYYGEYKKFFHEEIEACKRYDAVFVTSHRDGEILDQDVPQIPKYVIPNGVESSYFTPSAEKPEPHSLVFTGSMSYIPNSDGILDFLDKTFPLIQKKIPDVKLYIVGNGPPKRLLKRRSESVIITGFVDDVRPYVWKSSVYIVPLRMGSGTRLKVLEAMAMKIPIVTTSIGSEGILVENGHSVIIADDPEQFSQSVIRLFDDHALRQKLVTNGYEIMKKRYDWSAIGEQIEEQYERLVRKNRPTPSTTTAGGS